MTALDMFPEATAPVEINDSDQRFTLRATDEWCRKRAGVEKWDLDVAACEESHLAERYLTKADDGLTYQWRGNVWCNPPYSDIAPWIEKAWAEMERPAGVLTASVIAMLIPATRTEQPWWQRDVEPWRDRDIGRGRNGILLRTHFLPGRTSFGHPGNRDGVGVGSPPFTCVLLVWRRA